MKRNVRLTLCVRLIVPGGEVEELMAEFSTMVSQLLALRDWLKELGVTHVAMEPPACYLSPAGILRVIAARACWVREGQWGQRGGEAGEQGGEAVGVCRVRE
jgi:hypothetical protein